MKRHCGKIKQRFTQINRRFNLPIRRFIPAIRRFGFHQISDLICQFGSQTFPTCIRFGFVQILKFRMLIV